MAAALGFRTLRLFEDLQSASGEMHESELARAVENWVDQEVTRLSQEHRLDRYRGVSGPASDWIRPTGRDEAECREIGQSWLGPGDFALEALEAIDRGSPREAKEAYEAWRETAASVAAAIGIDIESDAPEVEEALIRAVLNGYWRVQQRLSDFQPSSIIPAAPRASAPVPPQPVAAALAIKKDGKSAICMGAAKPSPARTTAATPWAKT